MFLYPQVNLKIPRDRFAIPAERSHRIDKGIITNQVLIDTYAKAM